MQVLPVHGLPRVVAGDDLAALVADAAAAPDGPGLADSDVLVVSSKVVSKSEGRLVRGASRDEAVDAETARVVSAWTGSGGRTVIAATQHGFVLAAAGVDASNTEPGTLVLLPLDPDGSARRLRAALAERTGSNVAVVVSDTMGRPWRRGQTDLAVGAAGLVVLDDRRGSRDAFGTLLDVTVGAVADAVASAAALVAGKSALVAAVVVRGLGHLVLASGDDGDGAQALVRPPEEDRFRLGSPEAMRAGLLVRRTVRSFDDRPVPDDALVRAAEAAVTAPAPHHTSPWRFVVLDDPAGRTRLLDAMREAWVGDLRADGLDERTVQARVRRGDVLRSAPTVVVPFLVEHERHHYPDSRRRRAEHEMFTLAMGAGVEQFMSSLAVDGLGSAWVSSTLFCPDVVRGVLGVDPSWQPMGALAVGFPASGAGGQRTPRPPHDISSVLLRQ